MNQTLYDKILDGIIYYAKKKDALYFNLDIDENDTVLISPCSIYSPEQLIEHIYTGDITDCICHYLVFTENNENNFDATTIDELIEKLENYTKEKAKVNKAKKALKAYYKKHRYDYDFNYDWYKHEYFMLFGYYPGKKFGKSQHESIQVMVRVDFRYLDGKILSKLKDCIKYNDFSTVVEDFPDVTNCRFEEDPDLPTIYFYGTLLDEMLLEEITALPEKLADNKNVEDIFVKVIDD